MRSDDQPPMRRRTVPSSLSGKSHMGPIPKDGSRFSGFFSDGHQQSKSVRAKPQNGERSICPTEDVSPNVSSIGWQVFCRPRQSISVKVHHHKSIPPTPQRPCRWRLPTHTERLRAVRAQVVLRHHRHIYRRRRSISPLTAKYFL